MIISASLESVKLRDLVMTAAVLVLLVQSAAWAVKGPLAPPQAVAFENVDDPVLVEVGDVAIRVSDARAHAIKSNTLAAVLMPPAALMANGVVDEVADQVLLAKAATEIGLEEALEIRAELALARRQILSSAYLELTLRNAVTETALRDAYALAVHTAGEDQMVTLRRIQVSSEAEAVAIAGKLKAGTRFEELAKRRSLDMTTRTQGGLMAPAKLSVLPDFLAQAVQRLPVGQVSAPLKGEQGWYLLTVESRRAVRLPSFDDMRVSLERELRFEAISLALENAREGVPITTPEQNKTSPMILPSAASLATAW